MSRHWLKRGAHFQRALPFSTTRSRKRLDAAWIFDRARSVVGAEGVSVAEAVRTQHCNDESAEKGMPPDLVVFPTSVQQDRYYYSGVKLSSYPPFWWKFVLFVTFTTVQHTVV